MMRTAISTDKDISAWQDSETFHSLIEFLQNLAVSVEGLKINDKSLPHSDISLQLVEVLNQIDSFVDSNPVVKDKEVTRFGKPEFRGFYNDVERNCRSILSSCLSNDGILNYLIKSFGDFNRIDYGSGHELNFLVFLYCIYRSELIKDEDFPSIVLVVFARYLQLMRKIQMTYWLEPAGSHGMWGLDDYHFLPFLFGAYQLAPLTMLRPKSIHNKEIVEEFKNDYFYFNCIAFINHVKTGTDSLRWHSPMLDDISGARSWKKIADGMIKMYKVEVLGKAPIMQHLEFCELFPLPDTLTYKDVEAHNHEFGDCCGIKVPSAIAAAMNSGNIGL